MSLIYKRKYEERLDGIEKIIGHPVNLIWGPKPKTDGTNIYLPDEKMGIWDNEDMIRCGFSHEIAHIMFESDIDAMYDWIETWSNDGNKYNWYDPFNIVEKVAESTIQILEDQRIESLYGDIYAGARERFAEVSHRRIADVNDVEKDPITGLLLVRSGKWNDLRTFNDVRNVWGDIIDVDYFYTALDNVEMASHDATFLMAEQVMQKVIPWYEEKIRFAMDDNQLGEYIEELEDSEASLEGIKKEKGEVNKELKEKQQEKRDAEANNEWEKAEELEEKLNELFEEKQNIEQNLKEKQREVDNLKEEVQQKSEKIESENQEIENIQQYHDENNSIEDDKSLTRDDYEPPEKSMDNENHGVRDHDIEKSKSKMSGKLNDVREKMQGSQVKNATPSDGVATEIVKKQPAGAKKAEVFHGIVNEMVKEFRRIHGQKRHQLTETGESVNIDALIDSEARETAETEIMNSEISELGFSCSVVLDLSMSMIGPKLNVCRNVGATLQSCFEKLEQAGIPLDFQVIGYGGNHLHNKMMVKECEDVDDVKRMTHDPNFGSTPTWHAVDYTRRKMREKEGVKFMILVTDGTPTGLHENGDPVQSGRALTYTKKFIDKSNSEGISIFTLGIGVNLDDSEMRRVYGHFKNVDDESEAGVVLMEFVRHQVREHISLM